MRACLFVRCLAVQAFGASGGDPNPYAEAIPGFRVGTLITSNMQTLYTLASGGQIPTSAPIKYTVQLMSEWQMVGDRDPSTTLSIVSILTNGIVLPAPPRPSRRLVVLGDSLSSGVGCGFNRPPNSGCGASVLLDDVTNTWGNLLCASFGAECEIIAGSGITITANKGYNLPLVFPWTLGAMTYSDWPAQARVPWDFLGRPADAVLVELGENDCHAFNCSVEANLATLAKAYVEFAHVIAAAYNNTALPIFLSIANHEAGQSVAMKMALADPGMAGLNVSFLNATAPDVVNGTNIDVGCAGHPSIAQQQQTFLAARPVIAQALGW